jgi:hypothetical protein
MALSELCPNRAPPAFPTASRRLVPCVVPPHWPVWHREARFGFSPARQISCFGGAAGMCLRSMNQLRVTALGPLQDRPGAATGKRVPEGSLHQAEFAARTPRDDQRHRIRCGHHLDRALSEEPAPDFAGSRDLPPGITPALPALTPASRQGSRNGSEQLRHRKDLRRAIVIFCRVATPDQYDKER